MTQPTIAPAQTATMTPDVAAVVAKAQAIMQEANGRVLEAEDRIFAHMVAFVSRHHIASLGAPGTAKSLVADVLRSRIQGARGFKYLLTATTSPNELFGAYDTKAFDEGRMSFRTTSMLPEAHVAFLDETFKARSFLLNSLLALMNEREFSNGDTLQQSPLITLIGASNEAPRDEDDEPSLRALWDRFTLRLVVKPLSRAGRRAFLDAELARQEREAEGEDTSGKTGTTMTLAELALLQKACLKVQVPQLVKDLYWQIEDALEEEGLPTPSARRLGWQLPLIKASALLAGRMEARPEDLLILRHALWEDMEQIPAVAAIVYQHAMPALARVQADYDAIVEEATSLRRLSKKAGANSHQYDGRRAELLAKMKGALTGMRAELQTASAAGNVATARAIQQLGKDVTALQNELLQATAATWG